MSDDTPDVVAPEAAPVETPPVTPPEGGEPAVPDTNSPEPTEKPTETPEGDEGGDEEGADDAFEDDGKDPEVATRKTAKDFIIDRQKRKIEKMQKAQEGNEGGDEDDPEVDPVPVKPDEDDPDDDGNEAQMEAMKPIVEEHLAAQDAAEVTAFLEKNKDLDFGQYAGKVERLMKDPSRRQVPVDELFFAVAGRHLLKIGADRVRKADAEAKGTQSGGDSNRNGLAPKDWSTATKEELETEKQRVRMAR